MAAVICPRSAGRLKYYMILPEKKYKVYTLHNFEKIPQIGGISHK